MTKVETVDAVSSISVAADSAAFVSVGSRSAPVVVRGFEFENADAIYGIRDAIYAGSEPFSFGEVMVGKELAGELSISLGDEFALVLSNGSSRSVSVCGFFDLKVASLNSGWLLTTLNTSQSVFGFGTGVTSIEMHVKDVFSADAVAAQIASLLDDPSLKVDNWKAQNEQLLSGLQGQTISSLMIQVFVLASVVIAIASVLAIKVVQKSRQIGILKAMGIKDRGASLIFLFEGLILGVGGSVLGVLLGVGLLLSFVTFATNPDGSPLIDLYIDTTFVIGSGVVAVMAATLAAVVPARKSSKLSPIEVIRGG